jgi:hypothetical protein
MHTATRRSVTRATLGLLLLVAGTLAAFDAALAAAGKVLFVSGTVQVERGGTRALAKGDAIEVGDVIVTGSASRAQILMADGAKLALRAGTRFRIDGLTLPGTVTAPGQARATASVGSSAATLLKGGFRTVTGSVGKANPAGYQVRTPVGVLGIRGTDYAAVFCNGDCTDAPGVRPGEAIRDGLYLGVYRTGPGGISFRPDNGPPFDLDPGQFAFVPLNLPQPEPLATPPPVLDGDGAGPLRIGTLDAQLPGAAGGLDEFGNRRSPADAPRKTDGPAGPTGSPSLNQPIEGQGPNGPVDLTGGTAPPPPPSQQQNVAYAFSSFGSFGPPGGLNRNGLPATVDGNGNAVAIPVVVNINDVPGPGSIGIGSSALTNTGSDAGTGLRWGRWRGGSAQATSPAGGGPVDLGSQSLHWILAQPRDIAGTLPITGGTSFLLVGNTSPTDNLGNVGVLGSAGLVADFTARTVSFNVTLDIDGARWFGSISNVGGLGPDGVSFSGFSDTGNIGGNAPVTGILEGFFATPADGSPGVDGAGLTYTLLDVQDNRGIVSGALAFAPLGSQPPGPPPPERRDVSVSVGAIGQLNQFTDVETNQPTDYTQDANLRFTAFGGGIPAALQVDPGQYAIGTSAVAESNYDSLTLLRWGRWSGGQATATAGGQTTTIDLTNRSLHWIASANAQDPPTLPQTGTASYTLIGATSPTDSLGNVGVLDANATFQADFTNNQVGTTLALTTGQRAWTATGTGVIGAQIGLPAHQFAGNYVVGGSNNATGQAISGPGFFSGFFVAPGNPTAPGVPGGAGLTYTLEDAADGTTVQGSVSFRAP